MTPHKSPNSLNCTEQHEFNDHQLVLGYNLLSIDRKEVFLCRLLRCLIIICSINGWRCLLGYSRRLLCFGLSGIFNCSRFLALIWNLMRLLYRVFLGNILTLMELHVLITQLLDVPDTHSKPAHQNQKNMTQLSYNFMKQLFP